MKLSAKMTEKFVCKHCGMAFQKANTLSVHMCIKKRRYQESDLPQNRFGLAAFQRFFERTSASKTTKTLEEFINSPYYTDFVKFGNHLYLLKPSYPDKFIDFVISSGVKLSDWSKDAVFDAYIQNLIKTEPCDTGVDRSITEISEWAEKNSSLFHNFFRDVSPNEAASMIRTGKLSPWVLYLAPSSDSLLSRFNEDHSRIISHMIDPGFWMKKFKKESDDTNFVKALLIEAGL